MGKTRDKLNQLGKKLWGPCRVASEQPTSRSTGSVTSFLITDKSQPSNTKLSSDITVLPPTGAGNTTDHAEPPSKRLWHAAFDSLENGDEEIAKFVARYKSILQEQLGEDDGPGSSNLNQLDDPGARQAILSKFVENGREKIQNAKSAKLVRVAGNFSVFVLEAEKLIDAAVRSVPQAALPWAGVCLGLQILSNPMNEMQSNLEGIAHVISRMKWFCAWTDDVSFMGDEYVQQREGLSRMSQVLEDDILTLYRAVLIYQIKSVCSYYNNQGVNFVRGLLKIDDWDALLRAVMIAEQTLQSNLRNYQDAIVENTMNKIADEAKNMKGILGSILLTFQQIVTQHKEMNLDNQDKECLQDLQIKDFEIEKVENTKEHLLDGISDWIFDNKMYTEFINWDTSEANGPSPRLMWIRGEPGTGKTMLMMSIIRKLFSLSFCRAPGVSYFFCQGTEKDLRDATTTLRCLVWQLLSQQPLLITHVRDLHRKEGSTAFQGKHAFLTVRRAFKSMLKDENLRRIYLIVDALDECEQGLADLRQLILDSLDLSDRVKWLVSSRPCIQLDTPHVIDLDKDLLKVPVSTYISRKLATLKGREGYNDEILAEIEKEVGERAENTFLWVALAFKELNGCDSFAYVAHGSEALEIVKAMPSGLMRLYNHILLKIKSDIDAKKCENLLEVAAFAYRPLTLEDMHLFVDVKKAMQERIIKKCSSFLTLSNNTLYLIHQTAKEYLDETYKSKSRPAGTVAKKHWDISRRSIIEMSTILKRNIYEIEFGTEAKDIMRKNPDPLQSVRYACVFWVDHMCLGNDNSEDYKRALADDGMIHVFLKERLLFWLESLALMGQLPKGLSSIRELNRFVQIYTPKGGLATSLDDIVRFVSSHITIIRRVPLQAYGAALVFSPRLSGVVQSCLGERLPFIEESKGSIDHWGEHLQTLEGHDGRAYDVVFSPDSMTLVSVSPGTIWIWDVNTWTLKKTVVTALDSRGLASLISLAWSKDGKYLALASWDGLAEIWDANTWAQRWIFEHRSGCYGVAFSPDNMTLALVVEGTILLQDTRTWAIKQKLEDHTREVLGVAFSHDGKYLASSSSDKSTRIWDANTGAPLQILRGHRSGVWTSIFSPTGTTLASASDDKTIRLWDTTSWVHRQTLEGHEGDVMVLAFSRDGSMLASGSTDCSVRLWDVNAGTLHHVFRGHSDLIFGLAFSPLTDMLASAGNDCTVQIWDTNRIKNLHRAQTGASYDTTYLRSQRIAFSNDGSMVASALKSHTVQVWNAETAICLHNLEGHEDRILAVAFSPDNNTLASAGDELYVMLWDIDQGSHRKLKAIGKSSVDGLAFSPDGATLAFSSSDEVRLLDMTTGALLRILTSNSRGLHSVAFFSDSLVLASTAYAFHEKCFVNLWNIDTEADPHIIEEKLSVLYFRFPARAPFPNARTFMTPFGSIPLSSFGTELGQNADQSPPQYNLRIEDEGWIILDNRKILWLPPDYRAAGAAIYDNRIVLAHRSGELTFLTLRPPEAD